MKVGVAKETAPGERRVALVPEVLGKLTAAGLEILVERGAGAGSAIPDAAVRRTPARRSSRPTTLYAGADVDPAGRRSRPRRRSAGSDPGQARPRPPRAAHRPADAPRPSPTRGVTAISLDAIPRTLSPRPDDGRALVAGERRRLQGGPHRGQRLRPLLPAADDRRRHGQARQRPDPGHRRRRAPGDRHGPAPRRGGQGLRRPARRRASRPRASAPSSSSSRRRSTRPAPAATPAS